MDLKNIITHNSESTFLTPGGMINYDFLRISLKKKKAPRDSSFKTQLLKNEEFFFFFEKNNLIFILFSYILMMH